MKNIGSNYFFFLLQFCLIKRFRPTNYDITVEFYLVSPTINAGSITLKDSTQNNGEYHYHSDRDLIQSESLRILMWITAFMILFGNSYVTAITVKSLCFSKIMRASKWQHFIVLNIALSDMLMGLYLIIISIKNVKYEGRYNHFRQSWLSGGACYLIGSFVVISSQNTLFLMVLLMSYRLYSVKNVYVTPKRLSKIWTAMVGISWLVSIFIAIIPRSLIASDNQEHNSLCLPDFYKRPDRIISFIYTLVITTINFCCFLFIAVGYGLIYKISTKHPINNKQTAKLDARLYRRISRIIIVDSLSWAPIFFMSYLSFGLKIPGVVYIVTAGILLPINSAINPFLYSSLPEMIVKYFNSFKCRLRKPNVNNIKMMETTM